MRWFLLGAAMLASGCGTTQKQYGIPALPTVDFEPTAVRVGEFNGADVSPVPATEAARKLSSAQLRAAQKAADLELRWNQPGRAEGCLSSPRALHLYMYQTQSRIFVRTVYYAPACPGEVQHPIDALGPHGGTPSYAFDARGNLLGYGH